MGLILEEDQKRFFNQIAIEGIAHFLQPSTGFIQQDSLIPIYENFLAAHTLLSSKLKENIEKARETIDRLLHFQNIEGLFPRYLHEFPQAKIESYQLDIGFILKKIESKYAQVLSSELSKRLHTSIAALMESFEKNAPYSFERIQSRWVILKDLHQNKNPAFSYPEKKISSKYLSDQLLLAQETNYYEELLQRLSCFWHAPFHTYVGPLLDEDYIQGQPQLSLFDYYMSSYNRSYFEDLHKKNWLKLFGTLIKFSNVSGEFMEDSFHGIYKDFPYTLINKSNISWFFFTNYSSTNEESRGFHLFRCLFKSLGNLYHFVSHSKVKHQKAFFENDTLTIDFTYFDDFPEEVKQQNELEFYINRGEDLKVFVDSKKASLFHLGSVLELQTKDATLRCIFSSDSPDAQIVGHILNGNRPSSQDSLSLDSKAYDQKIILRTLRRSTNCKVRLQLRFVSSSV